MSGLALSRSAHAAGSDTIKIGMIGAGSRCSGAAANAMNAGPDVKLVAMCDVFENRLQDSRKALQDAVPGSGAGRRRPLFSAALTATRK